MTNRRDVVVVGAGIFGVTAALELQCRGYQVGVLDPGPVPHPLAASTDISKVVRMDYGADEEYISLAERARRGWILLNKDLGETLYHEVGAMMLTRSPMSPGSFEYESYHRLLKRGYQLQRLNPDLVAERYPAWNSKIYIDGYFNPYSGFVESGRAVDALIRRAAEVGVKFHVGQTAHNFIENNGRVTGIDSKEGERFEGEHVLVAAGTWTPILVPELAPVMHSVGQPVFHLKPDNPGLFSPPNFYVFSADVSRTGWYGFPVHPREGVIKIARHGVGRRLHPEADERIVSRDDEGWLRAFLAESLPALADAPIVRTRLCLYSDTLDEHFWIAQHPSRPGLTVAAGGSGHAFKFAPVLGPMIADAVEGRQNPSLQKFRWRILSPDTAGEEATRYRPVI